MMYKFEEQTVELAGLRPSPVRVTLQTERLRADLVAAARKDPGRIEPITVGVLGESRYIINGHLRTAALASAKVKSFRAHIVQVRDLQEVVALHIRLNRHGTVNPISMMDAIGYLKESYRQDQATRRYSELARKLLHPGSRKALEKFLEEACARFVHVELPVHVVEWIVSFESAREQLVATRVLLDSVRHSKEYRFAFPTPSDLDLICHSLRPREEAEKDVIVYEPEREASSWPRIAKKEAEGLVRGSQHDSILQCRCGKKLLLNTKTRTVSSVNDDRRDRCIKLVEEDPARPVFAVPQSVLEFLQAGSGDGLRFVRINSKRELARFASSIKDAPDLRLVVVIPG